METRLQVIFSHGELALRTALRLRPLRCYEDIVKAIYSPESSESRKPDVRSACEGRSIGAQNGAHLQEVAEERSTGSHSPFDEDGGRPFRDEH